MKMKIRPATEFVASLLMLVAVSAESGVYEFRDRTVDNDYLGTTTWKVSGVGNVTVPPGAGDTVYVTSGTGHDTLVSVTNNVSVDYRTLYFKAQPSSSFRFFTTDDAHTFAMPYSSGGQYANSALVFQNGNGKQFAAITCSSTGPICLWTNPQFALSSDGDGIPVLVFTRGTFDFLAPNGNDASANTYKQSDYAGTVLFSTNVIVKFPKVRLEDLAANLLFRGAIVTIGGSLTQTKGFVEVSDGATVAAGADVIIDGTEIPVLTVSNATFTVSGNNMDVGGSDNGRLIVEEGADLTVSGANSIQIAKLAGSGGLEVRGGNLETKRIRISRGNATADKTAYFLQTGGTTTLDGNGIQFQQSCTDGNVGTHYVRLDGGVLTAKSIFRETTVTAGTAYLSGDGGRYRAADAGTLAANLSYAEFGAKGLVVDTAGYDCSFAVVGRNKVGEDGVFVKDGSGTLTLSAASWNVSRTVVVKGTLLIPSSNSLATTLNVGSGAMFSTMGDASAVSLDSLSVTNGTLALDPGDLITVNGQVSVRKLKLAWSSVPSEATPFLVVSGEMDDATKAAIRSALFANALPDGTHASYTFDYDTGTEKTTVSASAATDTPLADSVTWTGSGAWATGANWLGGAAPTSSQIASFTSSSAGKTVTVVNGDKAGAIVFGTDGYTLVGAGQLEIVGEPGAAYITVTAGANTIDVPLLLSAQTSVPVDAGASLTIAKSVSFGGIAKTGAGKLTLGADNSTESGISSSDGILEVVAEGALGLSAMDGVTLRGGTIQYDEANGAAMHIPAGISVATSESSNLVVFKADTDTTLASLNVANGAICKRGAGRLTVRVPAGTTYRLVSESAGTAGPSSVQAWFPSGSAGVVFPDDGTAPDPSGGAYPAFSVAEGELAFVGDGPNAKVDMTSARTFLVGLYTKTCAVQPMLTVDNVYCDCQNNGSTFIGHSVGANNIGVTNPVLRIVNGGKVRISGAQIGYGSTSARSFVTIAATNGTFQATDSGHYLTRMYGDNGAKAYYRFEDSRMYLDGVVNYIGGGIDLDFDNSVLSSSSGGLVTLSTEQSNANRSNGVLAFRNGSTLAFGGFSELTSMNKELIFAFDNAEIMLHKDRASATLAASTTGHVHYEMRGVGAVLKPASGATYTINATMEGSGGFVVDSPGTVAFGANSAQFTGTLDVRQGTVDFAANGVAASFTAAKGAGTVSGASMGSLTLPIELLPNGTSSNSLMFANCTFGGGVKVDLGRTAETALARPYPENVLVARYTGTAPAVGSWRLVGTGVKGVRGKFTAANGEVRMNVKSAGVVLIMY